MKNTSLMSIKHFEQGVLPRRAVVDGQFLQPEDPATLAITDFTREHPASIDDALEDMIRLGVRALLLVRDQRVVGLITSYDIQGEKPMQFLQSTTYNQHRDIRVGHIMTPWEKLLAVDWDQLQSVRAGDLLNVIEDAGVSHLLVVEAAKRGAAPVVRALVSRARLQRQLKGLKLAS
jgi:CBS domain-containing protein